MLKRLILALLALCYANVATAQTFPKPPDVPAYVTVTPSYAAGTTLNILGDGSSNGGTPPAVTNGIELADIPTTEAGWSVAGTTQPLAPPRPEAKFRTTISGQVKILFDDPIRNYGQPGQSHCHSFFGNLAVTGYSTFAILRNNARKYSLAAGGPKNGTAYWYPCPIKTNPFADGFNYVVKPAGNSPIIVYYALDPAEAVKSQRLLLGMRYVAGINMDDPFQNWLRTIINNANAQAGTAGRYALVNPGSGANQETGNGGGFEARWTCNNGTTTHYAYWLKNTDNSDPFNGNCPSGSDLWMQFAGPTCWDGTNLWSPGGYKHVIPKIWDNVPDKYVCPNGWWELPSLQLQIHFPHTGFSDYGSWRLASDDMAGTLAGRTFRNGESFHTDWFGGWDRATLTDWLLNCIGISIEGGTARECDSSATSNTNTLLVNQQAAPTGRSPQVQNGSGNTTSPSGMFRLPNQMTGPATIHLPTH